MKQLATRSGIKEMLSSGVAMGCERKNYLKLPGFFYWGFPSFSQFHTLKNFWLRHWCKVIDIIEFNVFT